jgi:hypothetical protein
MTPEQERALRASVIGLLAAGGHGGSGGGGGGVDVARSGAAEILAAAARELDAMVEQRRAAVCRMEAVDYARTLRSFNARSALAIWKHAAATSGGQRGNEAEDEDEDEDDDNGLHAALVPLVTDMIGWLAAVTRHKPEVAREICGWDLDAEKRFDPAACLGEDEEGGGAAAAAALAREDARLRRLSRQARYSPEQLQLLVGVYDEYLAKARRTEDRLRAAAGELERAHSGGGPPQVPLADLEAALAAKTAAKNVAGIAFFQIATPVQAATLCAALHPFVFTCPAALRGAWLLWRGGQDGSDGAAPERG